MTQKYTHPTARQRMALGTCPECGDPPEAHSDDDRFWVRPLSACSLRLDGVQDRIAQYRAEVAEPSG